MATTALTAGQIAAHALTLVGSAVDTVTFTDDVDAVQVLNLSGTAAIYFTIDGTAPTVAGVNTYVLPAATGASLTVSIAPAGSITSVKLISSGTPQYSVQRVR